VGFAVGAGGGRLVFAVGAGGGPVGFAVGAGGGLVGGIVGVGSCGRIPDGLPDLGGGGEPC
jgi:hypothetical protein